MDQGFPTGRSRKRSTDSGTVFRGAIIQYRCIGVTGYRGRGEKNRSSRRLGDAVTRRERPMNHDQATWRRSDEAKNQHLGTIESKCSDTDQSAAGVLRSRFQVPGQEICSTVNSLMKSSFLFWQRENGEKKREQVSLLPVCWNMPGYPPTAQGWGEEVCQSLDPSPSRST